MAASSALLLMFSAPGAAADIIGPQDPDDPQPDSPWQAGTCKTDTPTCSVATDEQFFEQAAGHPPVGFTQFIVNTEPKLGGPVPVGNLRTVRVDLPPGLTVNPQSSAERCELGPEESPSTCASTAPASKVGTSTISATNPLTGFGLTLPTVDVYNVVPEHGEPARFGFSVLDNDIFLEADIEWEGDYHEYFTIHATKLELPGLPELEVARIAENRLVFDGTAGTDGTFITTPTTCFGPAEPGSRFEHLYSTWLRADSFEEEDPDFPDGSSFVESKLPPETDPKECVAIPFDPSLSVESDTDRTDSPSGPSVTVELPEVKDPAKAGRQGTSHVRSAQVELPRGMGLNPSAADGLEVCTDDEFNKGSRGSVGCPAGSRIGTVEVDTPPLPDGSLSGPVYVGEQLSRDPESGDLYRIFVVAESSRYDISARLVGRARVDRETGQVTTHFDDDELGKVTAPGLPQVPFESFRIDLDGEPSAVLTSPPTCRTHRARAELDPWSGSGAERRAGAFDLSSVPGGGPCPDRLGERAFAPGFQAIGTNAKAAGFTTLDFNIVRPAGQQELKGVTVDLPPGVSARLAGVPYCPEAAIAVAGASGGEAQKAAPSCPAASRVGAASVLTGSGSDPLRIAGTVYLAGPYKGAPLSLAVITPATAGPFDLGTVVVRVALHVHPETARVHAVADAIPHVFGGALLSIRSVAVAIDRPGFTLNPTKCLPMATYGTLNGGGADPLNPAAYSSVLRSSHFQVRGCKRLGLKPRLFLRLFGAKRRAKNPKLRAVLKPRRPDANLSRAAVILPKALILDQANIGKVCTRVQYAARACPRKSIYGWARAFSPLLDKPLQGRVFLRSSDNTLPDLVAALKGQVNIDLVSRTDSVRGRIRNIFDVVPDVPVSKVVYVLRGGPKGLLVNSRGLCGRKPLRAAMRFRAQNGKKLNRKVKLRTPCGKRR